ncbi:MAG: thioesterase family protein [Deltaproteobacteria bacterium]|nr:thioesterase family protein [Deltaproteobacteria bacterium]
MPNSPKVLSFVDVTKPHSNESNRYRGRLDESWFQGRGSFGGVLTAFAIRAFASTVADKRRRVRTLHLHFCAPVTTEPFVFDVEPARAGARVSHLIGRLIQDGKTAAIATATFAAPREDDLYVDDLKAPAALPLDDAFPIPLGQPGVPVFCRHFDMRFALGQPPYTQAQEARLGGHIRLREPQLVYEEGSDVVKDDAYEDALLSAFVDAWPPAAFACASAPRGGASVDLTLTFLHEVHHYEPDAFYIVDVESGFVRDGYAQETTHLFGPDGRSLVHCRQLVVLL